MASLHMCLRPRPTLQFLEVRKFKPLLLRSLRTRPVPKIPNRPSVPGAPSNLTDQDASQQPPRQSAPKQPNISNLLSQTDARTNSLLAPVHIPEDPRAVLKANHPSTALLEQSGIVIQRQIEMMNVFLGFEQANRYVIMSPEGNHIGYMAEHDGGIAKTMGRQWFRTHRSFMVHVFDRSGKEVLRFHRPFSWINTRIRVLDPVRLASGLSTSQTTELVQSDPAIDPATNQQVSSLALEEMKIIGEAQSEWAPLRRKYNLFLAHELHKQQEIGGEAIPTNLSPQQQHQVKGEDHFAQFAYVDEPFLSWDFSLKDSDAKLIGSVNRNWGGLGREFFTDTGTYVLRMDAVGLDREAEQKHIVSQSHQGERAYAETLGGQSAKYGMTLDQRAVMLATAVTVDFDYFSRHSHGGGIIPMPFMMGGGGAAEGGAAGGVAGAGAEGAVIGETVSGTVGRGAAGAVGGVGEGAIAGAGTMAGYEAMQRGMSGNDSNGSPQVPAESYPSAENSDMQDPQSPQYGSQAPTESAEQGQGGDVWGNESDPWAGDNSPSSGDGGAGSEEGGGGVISALWDIFGGSD